jgi:hypothetical protein
MLEMARQIGKRICLHRQIMQLTHWNKCTNTFNAFRLPVIEKLRSRIMFQISQTSFIPRLQFTLTSSPLSKAYGITRSGNPLIVPLALHPQPFKWAQLQPESTTLAFNVPGTCLTPPMDSLWRSIVLERSAETTFQVAMQKSISQQRSGVLLKLECRSYTTVLVKQQFP